MTVLFKQKEAEDILEDLTEIYNLWIKMKKFLLRSLSDSPLSGDTEQKFLNVKSQTSKYLRILAEKIDPHQFQYDPEKIQNILRQAISVTHLRGLPVSDRKNLLVLWHEVHVHLAQVLGAFKLISHGYQPKKKVKKDSSIAALKKGASDKKSKKKSGAGKAVLIIVLLIIVGAAIFFAISRM